MQKVIIDTNVIVSALISKGIPSKIINELVLNEKVQICTSDKIVEEYIEVLGRDKFAKFSKFKVNADIVISVISELAIRHNPTKKINLLKDLDDNKFLELAFELEVDFIITGNSNDFNIQKIGNTLIVSPTEYWNNHRP